MNLRQLFSTKRTPQTQPIPGSGQARNEAGGYVWSVDDWTRLDRFLILGSESGTYYIGPRALTHQNAEAVMRCIDEDGQRVVQRVVLISEAGRAPNNDPALFVLAMCAGLGDLDTRRAALAALPRVARTGTHLFHFLEFVEGFRGWGRGLRRAVGDWYRDMPLERLAFQTIKYQQRDGWSHRDALRLAHPTTGEANRETLFRWLTQGWETLSDEPDGDKALQTIWAFEQAKRATDERQIIALIERHNLPWEAIPTQWLGSATVWQTLLPRLPLTTLMRNLARLTALGVFAKYRPTQLVVNRLTDERRLRAARLHPITLLAALKTYAQGRGTRGTLRWEPEAKIVDALDRAFYLSFGTVKPTGKRWLLGLDVSGSMAGMRVNGIPGLQARVACAAMALVTAAVEPQHKFVAFDTRPYPLAISPRQRLDDVVKTLACTGGGGTDCALPILWATEKRLPVDAFVILTDAQTWYGQQHPAQAIQEYRRQVGIPAKLIVVAMAANRHTLADPNDAGVMNIVGFDTATPQLIADFVAEK